MDTIHTPMISIISILFLKHTLVDISFNDVVVGSETTNNGGLNSAIRTPLRPRDDSAVPSRYGLEPLNTSRLSNIAHLYEKQ